jgi:hypothetical protein
MLTALLIYLLLGPQETAPAVPPPPPLARLETDFQVTPFDAWWRTLDADREERWNAFFERLAVLPLDTNGRAEGPASPLPSGVAPSLELWAHFNRPALRQRVRFSRYIYDSVFGVEKRAEGEIFWDENSVRVDFRPPRNLPQGGETGTRTDRTGRLYKIVVSGAESYVVRGRSMITVNHDAKTFDRCEAPPLWLSGLYSLPASPFHEFRAADRAKTFAITTGPKHDPERQIHLKLEGLWRAWHQNYRTVEVLLDARTGGSQAMRLIDPAETRETVYVYEDFQRGGEGEVWDGNPFDPDLAGYVGTVLSVTR